MNGPILKALGLEAQFIVSGRRRVRKNDDNNYGNKDDSDDDCDDGDGSSDDGDDNSDDDDDNSDDDGTDQICAICDDGGQLLRYVHKNDCICLLFHFLYMCSISLSMP